MTRPQRPTTSIYLDNNSTTAILPEVVDAMTSCLREGYRNPASQHGSGRSARHVLEQARRQIAVILGASIKAPDQDQVIVTSGGTESNNLAIRGLVRSPGQILISDIEHPSAMAAAEQLAGVGCQIVPIPVTDSGHVLVESVQRLLSDGTRLVCVMFGNNETGTIQPIREIADLCAEAAIPMHCDAVQVVGKLPVSFRDLNVTTLAFSAHKFHGPRGVGGLILKAQTRLKPLLVGGAQQLGLRPGTESVALVVGMAKALELYQTSNGCWAVHMESMRNRLEQQLTNICGGRIIGSDPRLPHTTCISFPGLDRQALVMSLDLAGIECSTGSACTSGSSEPSHVLVAMGCEPSVVDGAIRLSLSHLNSGQDVNWAVDRICRAVNNLRDKK